MANLKSGITLQADETLVMELEAELWATSSNPLAKAIGSIKKVISKILGFKKSGFVVITNKRVVEVSTTIECYVFKTGQDVKYLLPSSVKEVGYERVTTCGCFCPAFYLYYEGHTQKTRVLLSGADEAEAQKVVDAFYRAISASQNGIA